MKKLKDTLLRDREEMEAIELSKYPYLLIEGDSVSEDQAKEIIVRTTDFGFVQITEFDILEKFFNVESQGGLLSCRQVREMEREVNSLHLKQIYNTPTLAHKHLAPKPYIVGWCHFDGRILSCIDYKGWRWPSVEELYDEWVEVAKAFPYLNLTCQVVDSDDDINAKQLVTYTVRSGKVEVLDNHLREIIIPSKFTVEGSPIQKFEENSHLEKLFKEAHQFTLNEMYNDSINVS